jgi:ferredoxin-NADP reductase
MARLQTFDSRVLESVVETPDTRTLVLDIALPPDAYRAGQYVSIDPHQFVVLRSVIGYLEQQKGRKEPPRAYSMCSAPHERHLAITIKEELFEAGRTKYPPLISGLLVHQVRAGDRLVVRGFAGGYVRPPDVESRTSHVLHVCAGSGSVPNFSMIKDSLHRHRALRHTLLYSNKTWDDVIFRDALTDLGARFGDRLSVVHTLTRGEPPPGAGTAVRRGRIDTALLGTVLSGEPDSLVYLCGPGISVWDRRAAAAAGTVPEPRFLEVMLGHLAALGVPPDRVHTEAFG